MNPAVLHALLAALLFGASTPLAKLLIGEMPPLLLAGLGMLAIVAGGAVLAWPAQAAGKHRA